MTDALEAFMQALTEQCERADLEGAIRACMLLNGPGIMVRVKDTGSPSFVPIKHEDFYDDGTRV